MRKMIFLLGVAVLLVGCSHSEQVLVDEKWWEAEVRVTYTEVEWYFSPTIVDGEITLTQQWRTVTMTRCERVKKGNELPVTYPTCASMEDDHVATECRYYVAYRDGKEDEKVARTDRGSWEGFQEGLHRVEINPWGRVSLP
jgi:hypothetical protein